MPPRNPNRGDGRQQSYWRPPAPQPRQYRPGGRFDIRLVNEEADVWGERLAQVAESQMRRFYEYVQGLKRRLDVEGGLDTEKRRQAFEALRPEFLMLKARAVYAHRRSERQFTSHALQFFIDHTASVRTVEDFEDFCRHFEAVMAFHKAYCQRQER